MTGGVGYRVMGVMLQVGVKALLKNSEGKYLLVKRSADKYPGIKGRWDIVGGRINPGITLYENLRREIKEETNLNIESMPVLISAQDILQNPKLHVVRLTYTAEIEGEVQLDLSENEEYRWLTLREIRKLKDLDYYFKKIIDKIK